MSDGFPSLWMRGGTSKAAVFLARDLPSDPGARDALLLRLMGSPDPRQIDGIGGGDPLTSKVAILSPSTRQDADVDYLFLQIFPDRALVSDAQPCGNILAAVGPAAIERGLIAAQAGVTPVRIHAVNTGEIAIAQIATPGGRVSYQGDCQIDGVPGHHAAVPLIFPPPAGALLPTGRAVDQIDNTDCTLINAGMPIVVLRARDFGLTGLESPQDLAQNAALKARLDLIRLMAGPMMGLGDVASSSVPKMTLVSAPTRGGAINTRSFIPHKVHDSIGVLAAISTAAACLLKHGPAAEVAHIPPDGHFRMETPSGAVAVFLDPQTGQAGTIRTARKLFDGLVFA